MWTAVAALVLLTVVSMIRRSRRQQLFRIRATWGAPIDRARRADAMFATHASRNAMLPSGRSLDERTWIDLNLGDVFAVLDRTQSTLGQHALYHRLRTAPLADHLAAFEALVQRMTCDQPARERAQLALDRLQDPNGYDVWWFARDDAIERRSWYVLFPILTAVTLTLAVLALFWSAAIVLLVAVVVLNLAVHYLTDFRIEDIARSLRQCAPLIGTAQSLRFIAGDDIDPIVRPLLADVPALGRLKSISRWVNGDPFLLPITADPLIMPLSQFVAAVYEALNLVLLLDGTGVFVAIADLSRHRGSLIRATAAAGDVDAAISVASFRAGRSDWTRPDSRVADAAIVFTDLRHPLLGDAVPNSIELRLGRGVLVTGSNMSGKSTFLRTVGVNAILAQTINTCLAQEYRAPIFDVRSSIGRSDDLLAGKSYYIAEVEALLALARASEEERPHLFILDELFRGTNAVERIAAGHAVLEELLSTASGGTKAHVVLAATHDRELVDLVADRYEAYHFGDAMGPEGLSFDHRLQRGPATTRNAIALLRLYGASHTLLSRATATAESLDRQRGITEVRASS